MADFSAYKTLWVSNCWWCPSTDRCAIPGRLLRLWTICHCINDCFGKWKAMGMLFEQDTMRDHFMQCLQEQNITTKPISGAPKCFERCRHTATWCHVLLWVIVDPGSSCILHLHKGYTLDLHCSVSKTLVFLSRNVGLVVGIPRFSLICTNSGLLVNSNPVHIQLYVVIDAGR